MKADNYLIYGIFFIVFPYTLVYIMSLLQIHLLSLSLPQLTDLSDSGIVMV